MTTNLAYDDERKFEMLDGKVYNMSPASIVHTTVSGNIYSIFRHYLKGKKCRVFSDGASIFFNEKDKPVPDMSIVCRPEIIGNFYINGAPDLIVEVLSPSTATNDKGYKKDLYEKNSVPEYWIVDTNNKSIEVYLLKDGKYKLDNIYAIFPDDVIAHMTEEERGKIVTEFKTSLFDDLIINLYDVFDKTL